MDDAQTNMMFGIPVFVKGQKVRYILETKTPLINGNVYVVKGVCVYAPGQQYIELEGHRHMYNVACFEELGPNGTSHSPSDI